VLGEHVAEVLGDRRGDAAALMGRRRRHEPDPAEPTFGVGDAAAGSDDSVVLFHHEEPVGLDCTNRSMLYGTTTRRRPAA
jgi:hypothetical protein